LGAYNGSMMEQLRRTATKRDFSGALPAVAPLAVVPP
jgi:hypothetical protein